MTAAVRAALRDAIEKGEAAEKATEALVNVPGSITDAELRAARDALGCVRGALAMLRALEPAAKKRRRA